MGLLCHSTGWAQVHDATAELDSDRWHYPFNFTPGARQNGPLFILSTTDSVLFNRRDGMAILKWTVGLPPQVTGPFRVVEARIRFWDRKQASYTLGVDPGIGIETAIELFAARFAPPFEESAWQGTEPYVGGGVGTATGDAERNPYPVDLLTGEHVENEVVTSVPWAEGEPAGYTPGAMTDSFPIDFHLDVNDSTIQAELQNDLLTGFSSWFVSAKFELDVQDGSAVPQVLFEEAVLNTGFGNSHQPPSLLIRVEGAPLSVGEWNLYR